jgi:hypothetical protein
MKGVKEMKKGGKRWIYEKSYLPLNVNGSFPLVMNKIFLESRLKSEMTIKWHFCTVQCFRFRNGDERGDESFELLSYSK